MNKMIRPSDLLPAKPGTTRAGDGLPRRAWTAEEVQKMIAAGIVEHGERFELIGGELIAMAAKGNFHEDVKAALIEFWLAIRPPDLRIVPETPLHLSDNDEPEPEVIVVPSAIRRRDVRGDTVLLVIEIADTSLKYDKLFKAARYAAFGVREYWVIDAVRLVTTVHRDPDGAGYRKVKEHKSQKLLTPHLAPALAVRLADLKLD